MRNLLGTMDTLEQRLQILERQFQRSRKFNRLLIFAVLAIACFAGAQGGPGKPQATSPKPSALDEEAPTDVERPAARDRLRTIEADQFVLLDKLGRSRAKMAVTEDGPVLAMFDEDGKKRLELSQASLASGLRLFDSDESPVVSLQVHRDDPAALEIKSSQGSSFTKAAGLSVRDAADLQQVYLALINGNFPVLGIGGSQSGPPSVEITPRAFKLHDDNRKPLFSVSSAEDGRTFLNMMHPNHERTLQICTGPKDVDGPRIEFFAPAREDGSGGTLPYLQFGFDSEREPHVNIFSSDGRPTFTAPTK